MKTAQLKYYIFSMLCLLLTTCISAQSKAEQKISFNQISESFLQHAKDGKDTRAFREKLAETTLEVIEEELQTDDQKLAFWINIYNAYIQVLLGEEPELYEDRQAFFNEDRIRIAGENVSFSKIEHGIIRKSQWPLGLGKIRKWFPNKFERKLRVDERDYRIHFALNCGAKDCPPVAIYEADRLNVQLDKSSKMFLEKTTSFDATKNEVAITSLFSWFRGDFGSKKDVKKILKEKRLIPRVKDIDIEYTDYDWTLDLDNWITL